MKLRFNGPRTLSCARLAASCAGLLLLPLLAACASSEPQANPAPTPTGCESSSEPCTETGAPTPTPVPTPTRPTPSPESGDWEVCWNTTGLQPEKVTEFAHAGSTKMLKFGIDGAVDDNGALRSDALVLYATSADVNEPDVEVWNLLDDQFVNVDDLWAQYYHGDDLVACEGVGIKSVTSMIVGDKPPTGDYRFMAWEVVFDKPLDLSGPGEIPRDFRLMLQSPDLSNGKNGGLGELAAVYKPVPSLPTQIDHPEWNE